MPTVFRCLDLRVVLNSRGREHDPPHVHAYYKDDLAVVDIKTCEIVSGYIPNSQFIKVKSFIDENKDELLKLWDEDPQNFERFK